MDGWKFWQWMDGCIDIGWREQPTKSLYCAPFPLDIFVVMFNYVLVLCLFLCLVNCDEQKYLHSASVLLIVWPRWKLQLPQATLENLKAWKRDVFSLCWRITAFCPPGEVYSENDDGKTVRTGFDQTDICTLSPPPLAPPQFEPHHIL